LRTHCENLAFMPFVRLNISAKSDLALRSKRGPSPTEESKEAGFTDTEGRCREVLFFDCHTGQAEVPSTASLQFSSLLEAWQSLKRSPQTDEEGGLSDVVSGDPLRRRAATRFSVRVCQGKWGR